MNNIIEIGTAISRLTARQFLAKIDAGETDFRRYSKVQVTGQVTLGKRVIETPVHLGNLIFCDDFDFGEISALAPVNADEACFKKGTYFSRAVFADYFRCGKLTSFDVFHLGGARFSRGFYCDQAKFNDTFFGNHATVKGGFFCGEAEFQTFICHDLQVGFFDCQHAIFYQGFHCNRLVVNDTFSFGGATFSNFESEPECEFNCGVARIEGEVLMECPTFERVVAAGMPSLAWVIEKYTNFNIHYKLRHAPPWLQPGKKI
jgi:hypothetical protein